MNKQLIPFAILLLLALRGHAQTSEPLTLIQSIEMPGVPIGVYTDHLGVDVKGHRLFATPESKKCVQVFDIEAGKFLHEIPGFGDPHSVLYRSDIDQLFVTDGEAGLLRIFNGRDYQPIKSVKLGLHADLTAYDPDTKYLYVVSGGAHVSIPESERKAYSFITVVDTTSGEALADIKIVAESLEAMVVERSTPRLYVNIRDKNQIGVLDRQKHTLVETWPITMGKNNYAIELDEAHHRLFVGCRISDVRSVIVVFDTQTGKEIKALPIGGNVDYLAFDPRSGRLYATCGTGDLDVYQERDTDSYTLIGKVETSIMAKTGLLVPELNLFFVSVPNFGGTQHAKILVFQVR
jgi:DNA-binding beta-propeller fold protein YncE